MGTGRFLPLAPPVELSFFSSLRICSLEGSFL